MATMRDWIKKVQLLIPNSVDKMHPLRIMEALNRAREYVSSYIISVNPEALGASITADVAAEVEYITLGKEINPQLIIKVYDQTHEKALTLADDIYHYSETGVPCYYYVMGSKLYLYPRPNADITLKIYYAKPLIQYTNLDDEIEDVIDVCNYCVAYAAVSLANNDVDMKTAQFELQKAEMQLYRMLGHPLRSEYPRIKNVYRY